MDFSALPLRNATGNIALKPGTAAPIPASPGFARPVLIGLAVMAVFFGSFTAWAVLAPLESAAIAYGAVSVDGRRKTIQHFEGGIIRDIAVREGSRVVKGQVLLRLDRTKARANLETLRGRLYAALALEARLIAERENASSVVFPRLLLQANRAAAVAETIAGQREIFRFRRKHLKSQVAVLRQHIERSKDEIDSLGEQIGWATRQIALIDEEAGVVKDLVDRGMGRRPRLLALQRGAANVRGRRALHRAQIARSKQGMYEARLRIAEFRMRRQNDIVKELRDVQERINDLHAQLRAAEDVFDRTVVKAPISGTVVDMRVSTPGGVIGPGDDIMDIFPNREKLVIEARVHPNDIDVVRVGLTAEIRLTAYDQRNTPTKSGRVVDISADSLSDERTGQPFYRAMVELDDSRTPHADGVELHPGMLVEVMIATGTQTVFDYLLKPITASVARAMREK